MPSAPITAANDTPDEATIVPPACNAIARLLARAVVRDLANAIPANRHAAPRKEEAE
ncbi:MAG: hypothetical protein IE937_09960 [Gammaproteobacteria bacterium]|uniref:hypothetical protein n=1 Tax=Thioclava sp. F36-7 TaxID=1915317 RepID=UPI00143C9A6F|nr:MULTISPECIES: hypothetical protein [unclassified Thioclava]MBD3755948.1 hypothetical protein [Gammaproteobacteria bacterium]MBD3804763.1 hypothetical protein [Thioclava sp.]